MWGYGVLCILDVRFYTEKCGFNIVSTERDGSVKLARFVIES